MRKNTKLKSRITMDFGKKKEKELIGLNLIKKLKTLNIVKMRFI